MEFDGQRHTQRRTHMQGEQQTMLENMRRRYLVTSPSRVASVEKTPELPGLPEVQEQHVTQRWKARKCLRKRETLESKPRDGAKT